MHSRGGLTQPFCRVSGLGHIGVWFRKACVLVAARALSRDKVGHIAILFTSPFAAPSPHQQTMSGDSSNPAAPASSDGASEKGEEEESYSCTFALSGPNFAHQVCVSSAQNLSSGSMCASCGRPQVCKGACL
eukprot:1178236-Prorocentrum_minimum.AAC.1